MMVTVYDLRSGDEYIFSLTPREAVIAAFAQSRGDWNTWTYEVKEVVVTYELKAH